MKLSALQIILRASLLLVGVGLQWSAQAQGSGGAVWRCGNTYTDQPCQTGQSGQTLERHDGRSAVQKREADQATREARTEAARLERERLRLEAARGPGQATLIDNAPRPRDEKPMNAKSVLKKPKPSKDPQYLGEPLTLNKKKRTKAQ